MNQTHMHPILQFKPWRDAGFTLSFIEERPNGVISILTKYEISTFAEGNEIPPEAEIPLPHGAAQYLMDQLWNAGIRPTENRDQSQTRELMQAHIDDLRKVAFKKLGIEG